MRPVFLLRKVTAKRRVDSQHIEIERGDAAVVDILRPCLPASRFTPDARPEETAERRDGDVSRNPSHTCVPSMP